MSLAATLSTGDKVYLMATGIKIGTSTKNCGKVIRDPSTVSNLLRTLEKGDARRVRKAFRAVGRNDLARLPRQHVQTIHQ